MATTYKKAPSPNPAAKKTPEATIAVTIKMATTKTQTVLLLTAGPMDALLPDG